MTTAAKTRPARSPYATRYHRDGSVTVWDVYAQGWRRTSTPGDAVLSSMQDAERARVMRHCGIAA